VTEENPFKLPEDKTSEVISAVAFFLVLLTCLLAYIAGKPPNPDPPSAEMQKELQRIADEFTPDWKRDHVR
jgi:hypothetical protein